MIQADLHMHSTASDGTLSPRALMAMAADGGFTHVALTDHDSLEGLDDARAEAGARGLVLIPGVELSCGGQKEIHVLGYGFDAGNAALRDFCRARTDERETRAEKMVQSLCQNGASIDMRRVRELAGGVVGRPHVARALVEAGHASSMSDAFDRFLVPGRCGYVPKTDVKVADAVKIIAQAGGVAVLAHPMELKMGEMALEALVHEWAGQGLCGMEVYHPSAPNNRVPFLAHLAAREGLLVTGGSDFHGANVREISLGEGLDRWHTQETDVPRLLRAIRAERV